MSIYSSIHTSKFVSIVPQKLSPLKSLKIKNPPSIVVIVNPVTIRKISSLNSRWKTKKEGPNRSINNEDIVEKAKRNVVSE